MKAFVILATKGRAKESYGLLTYLARQTQPVVQVIVVGTEQSDIEGLAEHPSAQSGLVQIHTAPAGSCKQRNTGLSLLSPHVKGMDSKEWFVVFFDDDFRPADDWIEECGKAFKSRSDLKGQSGRLLADGIVGDGYTEAQVEAFFNGSIPPARNAFLSDTPRHLKSLYGCNMAYRGDFASIERFDINLPLYGWQEDCDYSYRINSYGVMLFNPMCCGVHMGVPGGRTSGVRFGYSQIINPLFLIEKGTIDKRTAITLLSKNLISNVVRTIAFNRKKDYRGRLYGNMVAFKDILLNKSHPTNILKL